MTYRIGDFFAYARERHAIHLRRQSGQPAPWTEDEILRNNRFCSVFREDDKTTLWFNKNVRGPLRDKPEVLLATVIFRMFNRIATGEAVFQQGSLEGGTAFEKFLHDGDVRHLRRAIRAYCGSGPYTTGAYIISSPPGYAKLDGVLRIIDQFSKQRCEKKTCGKQDWRCAAERLVEIPNKQSLRRTWEWLRGFDYLGKFHSYEIVTDLRHTRLLHQAKDVDTWASVGPGARRGLNRLHDRRRPGSARRGWGLGIPEQAALEEMRQILAESRDAKYWPQEKGRFVLSKNKTEFGDGDVGAWPRWELRDVEHTLCEWEKYERVRLGEGKPRGSFNGG
jgi:hypothetical protein